MTDVTGLYQWCMEATSGDAEYCADVKNVADQVASTRVFRYSRNRFLVLPEVVYIAKLVEEDIAVLFPAKYAARVLLDDEKKRIAVMLEAPNHSVLLVYEREPRKEPVLKKTMFANRQIAPN